MNDQIENIKKNSIPVVLFGAGDIGTLAFHALKKKGYKSKFCL